MDGTTVFPLNVVHIEVLYESPPDLSSSDYPSNLIDGSEYIVRISMSHTHIRADTSPPDFTSIPMVFSTSTTHASIVVDSLS